MTEPDDAVHAAWIGSTTALGGDASVATRFADELVRRHREPPRHYHDTAHVTAVLRDAGALCDLLPISDEQRAVVRAAACAHDVVYEGRTGADERDSAEWARAALGEAAVVPALADRVHALVLATAEHRAPPGDNPAAILLDADLAVLGRDPAAYADYARAVRTEYAHVTDEQWRAGRGKVLRDLLAREPLFATAPAQARWETAARANMTAELAALNRGRGGG